MGFLVFLRAFSKSFSLGTWTFYSGREPSQHGGRESGENNCDLWWSPGPPLIPPVRKRLPWRSRKWAGVFISGFCNRPTHPRVTCECFCSGYTHAGQHPAPMLLTRHPAALQRWLCKNKSDFTLAPGNSITKSVRTIRKYLFFLC